jgi:hypothetical protein
MTNTWPTIIWSTHHEGLKVRGYVSCVLGTNIDPLLNVISIYTYSLKILRCLFSLLLLLHHHDRVSL